MIYYANANSEVVVSPGHRVVAKATTHPDAIRIAEALAMLDAVTTIFDTLRPTS